MINLFSTKVQVNVQPNILSPFTVKSKYSFMLLTVRRANGLIPEGLYLIKTVLENFKDKIFLC